MLSRALLLLSVAVAVAAQDPICLGDGSCVLSKPEGDCVDSAGWWPTEQVVVNVAARLTVRGEGVCALYIWLTEGSRVSVFWNGIIRGTVREDQCMELYAQPGYTMDTSNITLACLGGCTATMASNPIGTQCDADGDVGLTPAATALIVIGAALCCGMALCLMFCCCRALRGPRQRRDGGDVYVAVQA
eukprot:Hpha_TRINITY_DN14918_c3_g1::TRINITY_DN14918_c3_g1_i1::g.142977::m.142977